MNKGRRVSQGGGLDVLGTDKNGADMLQRAAVGHNIVALKQLLLHIEDSGGSYPMLSRCGTLHLPVLIDMFAYGVGCPEPLLAGRLS